MLEKLMLHSVAAQLTAGIMHGVTEPDPMKRQVIACQVQVNYYEWLKNTLTDPAWPIPVIDGAWLANVIKGVATTPTPSPTVPAPSLASIAPKAVAAAMQAQPHFVAMCKITPANPTGK